MPKFISFLSALSLCLTLQARAQSPPSSVPVPYDIEHTPFSLDDYSWMNATNRQPNSLLGVGPLTYQLYIDTYYAYQFSNPKDHTIFPTMEAPRHNEVGINLASLGVEVTGLDGPIGRIYIQYGNFTETVNGQDSSTSRGYYLQQRSMIGLQEAAAGWHLHALDGVNFEVGLFPSYVGLESSFSQENWNYLKPFVSDFTPFYFSGSRTEIYFTQRTKLEIWVVNGWQTYGKTNDAFGLGYLFNWRPNADWSFSNCAYDGSEDTSDPGSSRFFTDNNFQWHYYKDGQGWIKSSALAVVLDWGYESRSSNDLGGANGPMYGTSISNRVVYSSQWASAFRYDYYYDKTQALLIQPPRSSDGATPAPINYPPGAFVGAGWTATLDFTPSPWLVYRLEYMHRDASFPYFSGGGGITSSNGLKTTSSVGFTPDLRNSDDRVVANVTLRL